MDAMVIFVDWCHLHRRKNELDRYHQTRCYLGSLFYFIWYIFIYLDKIILFFPTSLIFFLRVNIVCFLEPAQFRLFILVHQLSSKNFNYDYLQTLITCEEVLINSTPYSSLPNFQFLHGLIYSIKQPLILLARLHHINLSL